MILNFLKGCGFAIISLFILFILIAISIVTGINIQLFFNLNPMKGFGLCLTIFIILLAGVLGIIENL